MPGKLARIDRRYTTHGPAKLTVKLRDLVTGGWFRTLDAHTQIGIKGQEGVCLLLDDRSCWNKKLNDDQEVIPLDVTIVAHDV